MTLQSTNLGEGLTLSYINTAKFKLGALSATVCMPCSPRSALLGSLLCGVLHRGTDKYPSFSALNRRLSMLYGAESGISCLRRADRLCFCVSATMLEQRYSLDSTDILGGVADILADIFFNPKKTNGLFPADIVESEKSILRDSLSAEKNNGGSYAMLRLRELMARQAPSATLEYMLSELESISPAELTGFHEALISLPISLMYVGGQALESAAEKLRLSFAPFMSSGISAPSPLSPRAPLPFVRVQEDKNAAQSHLAMGFSTGVCLGSAAYPAAQLLNEIFGASPASKLFLGVRERLGLCYSCHSAFNSLTGSIRVGAGIDGKNTERTEAEILACLDQIRAGGIGDAEFSAAQGSLAFYYTQLYDSSYSLSHFYTVRSLFGIESTPESELLAIRSTTPEQVAELARAAVYDTAFLLKGDRER